MKKSLLVTLSVAFVVLLAAAGARAQSGRLEPDPAVLRDPVLEKDSKSNLEKARHYFKLKKAYRASLSRAEEIVAGYPNFSQIDEALFIVGMSNLRLSRNEGTQKPSLSVEKHREEARHWLTKLVTEYPDSKFSKEAGKELASLGGPEPKTEKQ